MSQYLPLTSLTQKQNKSEHTSPSKQYRRLKVQLADRIFEVKKLQQDYAEQKTHLIQQFNQQRNTLNSTIRQLKQKIQVENQYWVNNIDKLRAENVQNIKQIYQKCRNNLQKQVEQKIRQCKIKHQLEIMELNRNINKLTEKLNQNQTIYQKTIRQIKQTNKASILYIQQKKQTELNELRKKLLHDQQLKISAVMHIKNSQQKQHTHTKHLLLKRQRQYNQNIQKLENKNFALGQQIWSLKRQIESLTKINEEKTVEICKLEQKTKSTVQLTTKQYEDQIKNIQRQWKQNIESLNQKWRHEYKKLQIAYQKVTAACAQKQRIWQQRGNKVLKLYQTRQARQQDMKLIQRLEVQLIKKQFELQRQKEQLKSCKLQMDNMEDIYKRIFHSVKKNHRHSQSFQLKKMRLPGITNKSTHPVKEQQ